MPGRGACLITFISRTSYKRLGKKQYVRYMFSRAIYSGEQPPLCA